MNGEVIVGTIIELDKSQTLATVIIGEEEVIDDLQVRQGCHLGDEIKIPWYLVEDSIY